MDRRVVVAVGLGRVDGVSIPDAGARTGFDPADVQQVHTVAGRRAWDARKRLPRQIAGEPAALLLASIIDDADGPEQQVMQRDATERVSSVGSRSGASDAVTACVPGSLILAKRVTERVAPGAMTSIVVSSTGWPLSTLRVTRTSRVSAAAKFFTCTSNRDGCPTTHKPADIFIDDTPTFWSSLVRARISVTFTSLSLSSSSLRMLSNCRNPAAWASVTN